MDNTNQGMGMGVGSSQSQDVPVQNNPIGPIPTMQPIKSDPLAYSTPTPQAESKSEKRPFVDPFAPAGLGTLPVSSAIPTSIPTPASTTPPISVAPISESISAPAQSSPSPAPKTEPSSNPAIITPHSFFPPEPPAPASLYPKASTPPTYVPVSNVTPSPEPTPMSVSNPAPASLYPHPQNPISVSEPTPIPTPVYTSEQSPVVPNHISLTPPPVDLKNGSIAYPTKVKKGGGFKHFIILVFILLILLLAGATAYAYVKKIGPFAFSTYTESNFSSSLLAKIANMNSASYTFSGAVNVVPRDADAVPFDIKISNEKELKQAYYYDKQKLEKAQRLISFLNSSANYNQSSSRFGNSYSSNSYSSNSKIKPKPYVSSLDQINLPENSDADILTSFEYQPVEDGSDFNLTVTFATDDAIKVISKGYGYSATSTKIDGKKVTFTKDSYISGYLSDEPPKPFLVAMSNSLSMLPPEMKASIAVGVSSDLQPGKLANWKINLDAQGDFGDMTYKINADALKKDENYYFKINNIPGFFLFNQLAALKGKWIMVPAKVESATSSATSTSSSSSASVGDDMGSYNYSPLSSIQSEIAGSEEKYKENRDKLAKLVKKVVAIADEEQIFIFKNKPMTEKVGDRNLVKYVLGLRKEKVLTFYTKIQDEINSNPDFTDYKGVLVDQGYINYLKSDEFSQTFDYIDKNNKITLWVDEEGFPAIVENVMRVVPPDSAVGLKGKQINVTFKLDISNINQPVFIQTPKDATPFDKVMEQMNEGIGLDNNGGSSDNGGPIDEARLKGQQASMKSSLSNMRAQAELFYDQNQNSYGKKTFALGPCSNATSTLFGDKMMFDLLNRVTKNNPSIATCVSDGSSGAVSSWAVSAPIPGDDGFSWCVDSKGASKRIIDKLKGKSCL